MKLLFVTDIYPYPTHSATAVIAFNWMRQLVPRHSLLLSSLQTPADDGAAKMVESLGATTLYAPFSRHPKGFASLRGTLSTSPVSFARFDGGLWAKWLQDCARQHSVDAVVAIGPVLSALFRPATRWPCPVLFVPYDSVSLNLAERLRFLVRSRQWGSVWPFPENPLRFVHYLVEYRKWAWVEQHLYLRPDACVAITPRDAEAISIRWDAAAKKRLHVIPYAVDPANFSPVSEPTVEGRLVFSGNMGSIESRASAMWFLKSVFPTVKKVVPDASLDIAGRDPSPALQKLARSFPGVRVTGYVPDIRSYLAAASVYVCPLLLGSGAKGRLLEALAMGKAVVATSASCHGLKAVNGEELVIADDPVTFQREVVDLLRNPQRRAALGVAARRAVERHHFWEAVGREVERLLATLLAERRGA